MSGYIDTVLSSVCLEPIFGACHTGEDAPFVGGLVGSDFPIISANSVAIGNVHFPHLATDTCNKEKFSNANIWEDVADPKVSIRYNFLQHTHLVVVVVVVIVGGG